MTVLETIRTRLRQLQPSDTDNVLKIFSDARAMAFAPRQATDDPAVARDFIDWQMRNYALHGLGAWAIVLKETDEFVGHAGLIPHGIGTELFYSLVPAYWHRGLASEAAAACRDHAFLRLGMDCLFAMIHPENLPAIRVAACIGMTQNGTIEFFNRQNALYEIHKQS